MPSPAAIVRRAIRMGIVPEYKEQVPFKEQTYSTQWALHILAVMSQNGTRPRSADVKHVIAETQDL